MGWGLLLKRIGIYLFDWSDECVDAELVVEGKVLSEAAIT